MDYLYWQNIDKNNFNVFVRDLSQKLNSDVKNIILDTYNDIDRDKIENKSKLMIELIEEKLDKNNK